MKTHTFRRLQPVSKKGMFGSNFRNFPGSFAPLPDPMAEVNRLVKMADEDLLWRPV